MEFRKDRDYYRCATDRYLIEQAQHGIDVDWRELAVALAERVDELACELRAKRCSACEE